MPGCARRISIRCHAASSWRQTPSSTTGRPRKKPASHWRRRRPPNGMYAMRVIPDGASALLEPARPALAVLAGLLHLVRPCADVGDRTLDAGAQPQGSRLLARGKLRSARAGSRAPPGSIHKERRRASGVPKCGVSQRASIVVLDLNLVGATIVVEIQRLRPEDAGPAEKPGGQRGKRAFAIVDPVARMVVSTIAELNVWSAVQIEGAGARRCRRRPGRWGARHPPDAVARAFRPQPTLTGTRVMVSLPKMSTTFTATW